MQIYLAYYSSKYLSTKERYVRLRLGHTILVGWERSPLLFPMFYCKVQVLGMDPKDVTADSSHKCHGQVLAKSYIACSHCFTTIII